MAKPFIKLLRTPNSGYFYDVGKNDIVRIDEKVYSYLNGIMTDSPVEADSDTIAIIEELKQAGYLSENRPRTIKHPLTEYSGLLLERKLDSLILQLTQDCNFRCKYCLYSEERYMKQRTHSQKNMTWETARKAVDFFLDHSVDSQHRYVGFYGGEPLLRFDLLKKIVDYTEDRLKGKPLTYNITTNGSLLTDEIVDYFILHNINTMISIDGPQEVHDKNRVLKSGEGTYDLIMKRIKNIKEKNPQYYGKLSINMVMDPTNDIDCINSVSVGPDTMNNLSLRASYMDSTDNDISYSPEFLSKSEYHGFLGYLSYFGHFPKELLSPIGQDYIQKLQSNNARFKTTGGMPAEISPTGPCLPGKARFFVTVDGQFFPCERVNESEVMCIGDLDRGFYYEKVKSILNIATLTSDKCTECWAMHHCGLCAKMADTGDVFSREKRLAHCARTINSAQTKLRSIILSKEIPEYYKEQAATRR